MLESRRPDVEAEHGAAVDLGGKLQPRRVAAHEAVVRRVLERGPVRRIEPRRVGGEFAVAQRPAARGVAHGAVARFQLVEGHAESRGAGLQQHGPRRGGHRSQRLPGVDRAGAADGDGESEAAHDLTQRGRAGARGDVALRVAERLRAVDEAEVVVVAVDRREFVAHARPVGVHFLGEDHRDRGDDRLAHLGTVDAEGDRAVGRDLDPGVQGDELWRARAELGGGVAVVEPVAGIAHEERAAGHQAGDDQGAA